MNSVPFVWVNILGHTSKILSSRYPKNKYAFPEKITILPSWRIRTNDPALSANIFMSL